MYNKLVYVNNNSLSIHASVQLHNTYLCVQQSHNFCNFKPNSKHLLIRTKIVVCGYNKLPSGTTQVNCTNTEMDICLSFSEETSTKQKF